MDQTITGSTTIASAESFPLPDSSVYHIRLQGVSPIASGEYFEPPSGVSIDPLSVPTSLYLSY